ncbi:hypothetical protein HFO56_02015 [Rhizobium laguerreae]|uniref:hypothetical protein n=1 Tax=Rhizobium laguerreae TaxID=1076926 RepID=UPI001C917AE9|nr:hypothetical protein [Rhizobium laguerreae]MBY3151183.1 hypothetical protein [Rhizobium laguerreae]
MEFRDRLFAGEDDVEVRRNEGYTWVEHLALSLYHFDNISPIKGVRHGLYACVGFGSGVQGLSRVFGPTTVIVDRQMLVRDMQAFLEKEDKPFVINPDTDFEVFDCMAAGFLTEVLPPLRFLHSGDLELTASLFSRYISAIPAGLGFVYVSNPKATGGIDLDMVKPPLWRRLFRREGIGRDIAGDDIWSAAVEHMTARVASAAFLSEQYADKLAASLEHLEKKAPTALKRDFENLATEMSDALEVRNVGGPWGSAAG